MRVDITVTDKSRPQSEGAESRLLIEHAFELARALGVQKLLVQADAAYDVQLVGRIREDEKVIWVTRGLDEEPPEPPIPGDLVVTIPEPELSRMSQIMFALFMALLNEHVQLDESVLCLSGVAGSQRLDTLLIANPARDFPWFRKRDIERTRQVIATRVFARVAEIALRFAAEGREGKPIGTIFVIGDMEQLAPYLRQLILNPFEGHPQKLRNIFNPDFLESLRELSALDGAFVINRRGVVETAGTYLNAPTTKVSLPTGYGARHTAAAALTGVVEALAVVISESSGSVTVFHGGEIILEFEKPGAAPRRRRRRRTATRAKAG